MALRQARSDEESRFTDEQVVRIVRESDAGGVPATARRTATRRYTKRRTIATSRLLREIHSCIAAPEFAASCHTPFRGESQLVDPASGRANMWLMRFVKLNTRKAYA